MTLYAGLLDGCSVAKLATLKPEWIIYSIVPYNKFYDLIDGVFLIDKELSSYIKVNHIYDLWLDKEKVDKEPYKLIIGFEGVINK